MKRPIWQTTGEDPDYRFTFANERTFLAWIRTALALLAGGLLIDQLGGHYPKLIILTLALVLLVSAVMLSAVAYLRWKANEIAMRNRKPLPHNTAVFGVCLATVFVAAIACAMIIR